MTKQSHAHEPDTEAVHARLEQFQASHETLDRSWGELVLAHQSEWAAAYGNSVVVGGTLEDVIEEAKSLDWPLGVVAIRYIQATRPATLL